jgi:GT2 family glycosyltransferase
MGRLVARGKYIHDGAEKVFARGVSYGPFAPNSRGERYPEPARAEADFILMRQLGANLVRVYVQPPSWMFELAVKHGLRMMVGMPWPFHIAFLDSRQMEREIRETIRGSVSEMRQFSDAIFAYSIGNEVRSDIVRWHGARKVSRFLRELYDIGKQADPEGLFTYSNYPSAEYLDLNFLDFVSFNVYLHREPDFRRYLTHLMAVTRDRPLVLSETGMDTMREGEAHQAELLSWQARAAFELGLSGFVVFAFTDEWHTGGAEITDWEFGLVTRERAPKQAFAAMREVFAGPVPGPLANAPKASVIVPAYNAQATLAACLESLKHLNYPDYETIVADDGSTDATADIAATAGVRALKLEHCGLAAARNAGIAAASGRIVAFIDADARAERDWLYHLVETITRRDASAAGGQNFAPENISGTAAAIAAAPGEPREVRAGDDQLAQVCGCGMALDKARFASAEVFDPAFTTAGDDVDFSWRLRDLGIELAYAPAAVVIHERRRTVAAYLAQQRGYGHAEGLLFRKYPERGASGDGVYGGSGWLANWFGIAPRVYYGAFGRGLFQSVYPGAILPLAAQLPLTIEWVAAAIILIAAGVFERFFAVLGCAGLALSIISACAGAALTPAKTVRGPGGHILTAFLWLAGPLVRSFARERVKWSFAPDTSSPPMAVPGGRSGRIVLSYGNGAAGAPAEAETILSAMHLALVRRGAAVAKGGKYDPFDLEIIVPPWIRAPLLMLERGSHISIGWRIGIAPWHIAMAAAIPLALMLVAGFSLAASIAIAAAVILIAGAIAMLRARRIAALVCAAAAEVAARFGLQAESAPGNL